MIANSEYIADHVRSLYDLPDTRLVTIPRGVDTDVFDPARVEAGKVSDLRASLINEREFLAILPGRLTEWKGQGLLVEALARLPDDQKSRLQVCLIGDAQGRNEYVSGLRLQIHAAGLDESVNISGHYSDMPTLYAASDLVLAPSTRPEAFGRIAIEAGAMGKPVIVADHGGQRETVINEETGWRFAPKDADALAEALKRFLSLTPDAREVMGSAARQLVSSRYTKSALQAATLEVYDRVLTQGAHA